jgi:hypothetical protein
MEQTFNLKSVAIGLLLSAAVVGAALAFAFLSAG